MEKLDIVAEQRRRALQTRNLVAERTDDVGGREGIAIRGVPLVLQGERYSCDSIPSLTKREGEEDDQDVRLVSGRRAQRERNEDRVDLSQRPSISIIQ